MVPLLETTLSTSKSRRMMLRDTGNLVAMSLLLLTFFHSTGAFAIKNRLNVCIVTDNAYVNQCFEGNEDAAINFTINLIDDINQHLLNEEFVYTDLVTGETFTYTNFAFHPRVIKLGHKAFIQFNRQRILNVNHLKTTLNSSSLKPELLDNALVAFFTGKPITGYNGFSCGAVCSPPNNSLVVSFHECPLKGGSEAYERVLITTFHELLHIIGVPHSNDTDNDVMKEVGASNMNLGLQTRKFIAESLYHAEINSCLAEEDEIVRLYYLNETKMTVAYGEVVEHRNAIVKKELEKEETTDEPPTSLYTALIYFFWFIIGCAVIIPISYYVYKKLFPTKHEAVPQEEPQVVTVDYIRQGGGGARQRGARRRNRERNLVN